MTAGVTITDPRRVPQTFAQRVRAWIALTKPRIIELLLITTVPAMLVAAGGWPDTGLVVATVIGGTLSAGGANAMNNVTDRDIDARMRRTRHRPLPAHRVEPGEALVVGAVFGTAGFVVLWLGANLAAAVLATAALAWTPSHFWALAVRFRDDYENAGVPMLPVVAGIRETALQIVMYAVLTTGFSLMLQPVAGLGLPYLVVAMASGAWFVWESLRLLRDEERAMLLFRYSNVYLTVLFAAMAVDALV